MAILTAVSLVLMLSLTVGPAVTSLVWLHQRDKARLAEQIAANQLRETYAAQARTLRRGGQPGRRFEALSLLAKAARISPGPDLRDEAIACMALVDVRVDRQWPIDLPSFSRPAADRMFERYCLSDDGGNLAIHSLKDDSLLLSLPGFGKRCQAMQFSPDGRFLAASYDDHEFYFWELAQGEALPWITGEVTAWAFSHDGQLMAIGRADRAIELLSLSDGQTQGRFKVDDVPISLDIAPNGMSLAAACGHVVKILDVATGRDLATLPHQGEVQCVRWGAKGRLLATLSYQNYIRVWEVDGWKLAWRDKPHLVTRVTAARETDAQHIAFSPDGDLLACEGLEGIRIFDPWSGRVLLSLGGLLSGAQGSDAFGPDGKSLFGLTVDHAHAVCWEVGRGNEFRQIVQYAGEGSGSAVSVDFHPGDHLLAVGEGRGTRLVDPATGLDLARLETGTSETVRFRPDGEGLATAAVHGLAFWPIGVRDEGSTRHHIVGPPRALYQSSATGYASGVAWGPDGRFLAWSDRPRGEVIIEDLELQTARKVFSGIAHLRDLAISPDGRWLVTCPWRGSAIQVRELKTGRLVWQLEGDRGRALFSPNGRLLATAMDDMIRFWQVGSWHLLRELTCKAAGAMAFNPDGSLLAVNSANGVVRLIDPEIAKEEAKLENPDPGVDPFQLAFCSDGTLLAMANGRRAVQLWDLAQVRQTLAKIGLAWERPQPPPNDFPLALGTLELHEMKRDARLAEHAGEWSRAISMRSALISADPVDHNQWLRRGHDRVQIGQWREALADFEAASRVERTSAVLRGQVGFLVGPEETWNGWRPVPDRWYHLALTFDDATGILKVFIDGSVVMWRRTTRPPGYDGHPLIIGAIMESGLPKAAFWGKAANLQMWRVARTQSQIQADLRKFLDGDDPVSADLIGRWIPGGGAATILVDSSGHHHDGRIVGSVSVVSIEGRAPAGLPPACRYALSFEGPEGYIEIPDAPCLRPRSFTLEGWFNFADVFRGSCLFSKPVGDRSAVSLALEYQDAGSAQELEARVAQALALLAMGDHGEYKRLCVWLVARYRETQDASLASEVAHIASLGPTSLDEFGPCIELAERAVAAEGGHDSLSMLGAVLYRAGQYSRAASHLQQAASMHGKGGTPQNQIFLAMTYHAMGDDLRARDELNRTETSIPQTLAAKSQSRPGERLPDDWVTPAEMRMLRAEAGSLLMDASFPTQPFR
jgi:WD40 repeat protein/tetratricopeptide (TPR) repeat protein